MGLARLNYADDYPQLIEEAHRRSPRPVGAPALTWHIGLRDETEPTDVEQTEGFHRAIRDLVTCIYDRAKIPHQQRVLLDESRSADTRAGARSLTVPIELGYGKQLLKIIFERHFEYTTITFLFDLSKPSSQKIGNYEMDSDSVLASVAKAKAAITELGQKLTQWQRSSAQDDAGKKTRAEIHRKLQQIQGQLYSVFWDRLRADLGLGWPLFGSDQKTAVFADFRGVVLSAGDEDCFDEWYKFSTIQDVATFDNPTNITAIERLHPFINATHGNFDDTELIICNMLRRRAIFMSSVGDAGPYIARQDGRTAAMPTAEPLTYLMLVNGFEAAKSRGGGRKPYERWQLGRMIARIHNLGSLRLMGLRDLPDLLVKGDEAQRLGVQIDGLSKQLMSDGNKWSSHHRRELIRLFSDLNRLNDVKHGGLSFRISRARAYFTAFNRLIGDLNIEAIEGYVAYDVFMRRQMYGVFDYIDRIGLLVETMSQRTNTLFTFVDAQDQEETLQGILDLQTAIVNLQGTAELFLPLIVAYYLRDPLAKLLAPALPNGPLRLWEWRFEGKDLAYAIVVVFVGVAFVIKWVIQKLRSAKAAAKG